ncbi:hypothetical protein GCM10020219_051580 [Nonomuraea dietziae]
MRWTLVARRWACLVLGGALLMPYMMLGVLVSGTVGRVGADLLLPIDVLVFVAVLPVVALTGLFLPLRAFEVSAAEGLLGVRIDPLPRRARTWAERRRMAAWFTLHLGVGGVVSGVTLAIVPFVVWSMAVPFTGDRFGILGQGTPLGWWPLGGLAFLVLLVALVQGAGALLARLAPVLLGPLALRPARPRRGAGPHARRAQQAGPRTARLRRSRAERGHPAGPRRPAGCSTATPRPPGSRWRPSSSRPGPRWRTSTTCWAS